MKKNTLEETVKVSTSGGLLLGELLLPKEAKGMVLFAHGSGSSRFSPRNQFVAKFFENLSLGSLLIDLLTSEEEQIDQSSGALRFDIALLAGRLLEVTDWLLQNPHTKDLQIGYFGASTGAAAALIAAAQKTEIAAVVSRGGRPDLAKDYLAAVRAPTLLIVGGNDTDVISLNQMAFELLQCEKKMEIVARATHLFEEPGTLEEVARLSGRWFLQYFKPDLRNDGFYGFKI